MSGFSCPHSGTSAQAPPTGLGWRWRPGPAYAGQRWEQPEGDPVQLGMVGLGRMGAGLVRRLLRDGHTCVVYDVDPGAVERTVADGATGTNTLEEFVAALDKP